MISENCNNTLLCIRHPNSFYIKLAHGHAERHEIEWLAKDNCNWSPVNRL